MATSTKKGAEADYSTEEKIASLYDLQQIDSKIDEINKLKGELPLEVQDLEDEVAGLETRIEKVNADIEDVSQKTRQAKESIEHSKSLIIKYEEQQKNVRNNREFDSLSKETEYQKLEIELAEKHIKEFAVEAKINKKLAEDFIEVLSGRRIDLKAKREELDAIDKETEKELSALEAKSKKAAEKIDERLLVAYRRIRKNVLNGLAVVTVKRDACGGCYNRIPPQRQVDIRLSKKITVCEYCGRVIVSDDLDQVDE